MAKKVKFYRADGSKCTREYVRKKQMLHAEWFRSTNDGYGGFKRPCEESARIIEQMTEEAYCDEYKMFTYVDRSARRAPVEYATSHRLEDMVVCELPLGDDETHDAIGQQGEAQADRNATA